MATLIARFRLWRWKKNLNKQNMKTLHVTNPIHRPPLPRALLLIAPALIILVALTSQVLAQTGGTTGTTMRFSGIIDDFTPALDASGPWQVSGQWSLSLIFNSGPGNVSVVLNMVRAEDVNRNAHTHHVTLSDGQVTPLANGFQITGNAVITSNGNLAGFSGSPVTVQVTGGDTVQFSNIALTFGGAAVMHLGDQPFHGVVTQQAVQRPPPPRP